MRNKFAPEAELCPPEAFLSRVYNAGLSEGDGNTPAGLHSQEYFLNHITCHYVYALRSWLPGGNEKWNQLSGPSQELHSATAFS